ISGQDLVEWQLRVAAGEHLPKTQQQLVITGHAFEARIYAEDANNDFLPATGKLNLLKTPIESKHVRIDTGVRQGDEVSVYYDPMIAKLIVWDESREKALQRLAKALSEYRINGVTTNIDFLYNLATSAPFKAADIDTGFIEKNYDLIFHNDKKPLVNELPITALFLILSKENKAKQQAKQSNDPHSPWYNANAWRLNEANLHTLVLAHNDIEYTVTVEQKNQGNHAYYLIEINGEKFDCQGELLTTPLNNDTIVATINGHRSQTTFNHFENNISLYRANGVFNFTHILPDCGQYDNDDNHGGLAAPMNGTMVSVLVKAGEQVSKNQSLVIMEAMKMEHTIKAPSDGIIDEIFFQAGDMVDGGAELLAFTAQTDISIGSE
ncbi:MAG: 3-methylcrotonyl-CoA carboxylase, partial [Colwellia sp.]|nr:3-methylcrotonyl-CoA carboxylase [Colwellia sp.]